MKLGKPLLAMMDGQSALILDVGLEGAFLEHYGAAKTGDRFMLSFRWKGDEIKFGCEVRRTNVIRPAEEGQATVSHSGVIFIEKSGDSTAKLVDMMGTFVGRVLAASPRELDVVLRLVPRARQLRPDVTVFRNHDDRVR